jgi:hypothetical protein
MTLVRALHGRPPWPELELQGRHHGGAHRRGERGGRRGGDGGATAGRSTMGIGLLRPVAPLFGLHAAVREKKGGRRKEKRTEQREKKRRSEGKMGIISKLGNF